MKWFDKLEGAKKRARNDETGAYSHLTIAEPCYGPRTKILAIGGGKGGIGKSLLTVNLGILLSKQGYRVLLVDADLGAANLHTFMGIEGSKVSLSSFLKGNVTDLQPLIIKTNIPNLRPLKNPFRLSPLYF